MWTETSVTVVLNILVNFHSIPCFNSVTNVMSVCTTVIMYFSDDGSHNVCDDTRKRIESEMGPKSVEVVSECIAKTDYLTICKLSAGGPAADIDDSILKALRNGIYLSYYTLSMLSMCKVHSVFKGGFVHLA